MGSECCGSVCTKCHAGKLIVLGLILIINQLYLNWSWWLLIGGLIALKGVLMLLKPSCGHCDVPAKKGKK